MQHHDNPHRPHERSEKQPDPLHSMTLSECRLRSVEVFIPDSDYVLHDDKAARLSQLLKAFGFTFLTQSARQNVASTLVTALESETRLTDRELAQIQKSLFPVTYEPTHNDQHEQEPLYGLSITCIGRLEAPADRLEASSQIAPRSLQEILLKHVEVHEYEECFDDWQHATFLGGQSEDYDPFPGSMQEIESPILSLAYNPDSERPGFSCTITFNPEVEEAEREVNWDCANYFLSNAGLLSLPAVLNDSWTTERDPIASVIRATHGCCSIEMEVPCESTQDVAPFAQLITPSVSGSVWSDLPLALSGHVVVIDPPDFVLAEICESMGVPEAKELIRTVLVSGCSNDNPTTALAPLIRKLGGGEVQVYDDHISNSEVLESSSKAAIELDDTPVGAVYIEIAFGRNFTFSVYPPTPSRGDSQEALAHQTEQIRRALKIPWDRIRAIAREYNGD